MAGSSYLPGEAVFLPASMAAASEAAAAFSQPDLPPVAATNVQLDPASCNVPKKGTAKSKTSGKKAKQGSVVSNFTPAAAVGAAATSVVTGQPLELDEVAAAAQVAAAASAASTNPDILQFQPVVDPSAAAAAAAVGMQPLETYEAYTAAVASAAVDLDSETDSNHDTALTLACAGGHEELVTLLINRGANIGEQFRPVFS